MSDNNSVKKKRVKPIAIIAAVIIILCIIIAIPLIVLMNKTEASFDNIQLRLSNNVINTAKDYYILKKNEGYIKDLEDINGKHLTDEECELQMKLYCIRMSGNINTSSAINGRRIHVSDVWNYYDGDLNNFVSDNRDMIIFSKKTDDSESKARLIYTFENDDFTGKMNAVKDEVYNGGGEAFIHIEDIYIKDFTFIPKKIEYFIVKGNLGDPVMKSLYEEEKSDDEMKQEGYELYETDSTFAMVGSMGDDFEYISSMDHDTRDKINECIKEYKDSGKPKEMRKKLSHKPLCFEVIDIKEHSVDGTDSRYYVATYEKKDVLMQLGTVFGIVK
ncbi:MAG: hypothetical protein K6G76_01795 [Lachnospiraceae bacterium]|nr:hypothetical protein [Lachnospiraceae bacterium]